MVLAQVTSGSPNAALGADRLHPSGQSEVADCCCQAPRLAIGVVPERVPPQLRRGEGSEEAQYEILAPVGSPSLTGSADTDVSTASSDGVSAFVARVLDQLALSAWFPAAFLTAGAAVLLEFRSLKSANILDAVAKLTAHPVQVLVIMIPLLVIATVITQAFSFEAIRILEGYWPSRGPSGFVCKVMTSRHVHRKKAIIERLGRESMQAFRAAVSDMVFHGDGVSGPVARAVEAQLSGSASEIPQLEGNQLEEFVDTLQTWRDEADAWRLARVDRLLAERESYPVDSRILPTKLGNLIRATEDDLQYAGADVRGFVLRQRNTVSRRIQTQHDQFRTRLDMYCTLVFVSLLLAAITPLALNLHVGIAAIVITTGIFVAMAVASYLAAIASADGYCTALKQMDAVSAASSER
jgi:hypothetical protein